MLRGISTVSFYAADLDAAKAWYTKFLGIEPYFGKPGYVEFRVGDYQHELGIIDARYLPDGLPAVPSGEIVYWHVDDLTATLERLESLGAKLHEPVIIRGDGFITASVVDPFGNILGAMKNVHYLEILGR
jgi:predicted enzyme related to lactoylglutathione lyase